MSKTPAIAALLTLAALAAPTAARADWIIEQVSNAAPGMQGGGGARPVRQELLAKAGRLLVIDRDGGRWAGLFRLDERKVYEFDLLKKTYFERSFDWYKSHRARRDREIAEIRSRYEKMTDPRFKEDMRKEMIRDGIRPDGKVIATVERTGKTQRIGPWETEQVLVLENGKQVFDLWVTKDLERPTALFDLYRALGLFGDDVVRKAAEVDGFPILFDVRIDVGGPFSGNQQAEILSVRDVEEIPDAHFEIPEGFEKVDPPEPGGVAAKPEILGNPVQCFWCGKTVGDKKALQFRNPFERFKAYWICSDECRKGIAADVRKTRGAATPLGKRKE